jgi:hypothetical protein
LIAWLFTDEYLIKLSQVRQFAYHITRQIVFSFDIAFFSWSAVTELNIAAILNAHLYLRIALTVESGQSLPMDDSRCAQMCVAYLFHAS